MGGCAEIMHIITNAQENGISTIDLNGARTGAKELWLLSDTWQRTGQEKRQCILRPEKKWQATRRRAAILV